MSNSPAGGSPAGGKVLAAVDLGATSGRVVLGHVGADRLDLEVVHRFANTPVQTPDGLHTDVLGLYGQVLEGLRAAGRRYRVDGVAVDSWAVDYGLLRGDHLLSAPFHYRDDRSAAGVEKVHGLVDPAELYRRNGLQHLPFTTIYQLAIDDLVALADSWLLVPDLLTWWLNGSRWAEATNASTTGVVDVHSRTWDRDLLDRVGLGSLPLPDLVEPGTRLGGLRPEVSDAVGIRPEVTTVGSHDTASAVVGVPMEAGSAAYVSCGTWGLVGVELERPVVTEEARLAGFTNEGGVDGRTRFLHNVMGLWVLTETIRTWERETGESVDLGDLLEAAAGVTAPVAVVDVDDPRFLPPGDMPARIAQLCAEAGVAAPRNKAETARCILESLAEAFARTVRAAAELSGTDVSVVHVVGGGSRNALLCQLTADRLGLPVEAGPEEATALGNVLVQARTLGAVSGDLESLRARIGAAWTPRRFHPRPIREATR